MAEVLTKPSRRIRNMVMKELRLIIKDKVALLLIFLLPAALIGMLWYVTDASSLGGMTLGGTPDIGGGDDAGNETSSDSGIQLGIVDLDTTSGYYGAEDLSENLTAFYETMANVTIYNSTADAYRALYEQLIDAYIVIPDGFEANLTDNFPTYIEVHYDGNDLLGSASIQGVIQAGT
ncbi:MAG: ABC transporter permease, partial [Candidatus Thorarchaeota archaeon]